MTPQFTATPHSKGWGLILRTLRDIGRPVTRAKLAQAMGKSAGYTQGYLPTMVSAGVVRMVGASRTNQLGSNIGKPPKLYALPESAS